MKYLGTSKFLLTQGSIEMMDELSMREVKRLLDVVSLLVFSDNSHAALQDELMILVRKQLCHTDPKYVLVEFILHLVLSILVFNASLNLEIQTVEGIPSVGQGLMLSTMDFHFYFSFSSQISLKNIPIFLQI